MAVVSGRHHAAQVDPSVVREHFRGRDLGVRVGWVPLDDLIVYDPPRHGNKSHMELVAKLSNGWPYDIPMIWVAEGDGLHLHDGHHRVRAAQAAGLDRLPAVVYDHTPFLEAERDFGVSRTGYIFDVLAELDPVAKRNASKGKHRELAVAGPTYELLFEHLGRAREVRLDFLETLCPHTIHPSVESPRETGDYLIGEDPWFLCFAVRNAVLVRWHDILRSPVASQQRFADWVIDRIGDDPLRLWFSITGPSGLDPSRIALKLHRNSTATEDPQTAQAFAHALAFGHLFRGVHSVEDLPWVALQYVDRHSDKVWMFYDQGWAGYRMWGRRDRRYTGQLDVNGPDLEQVGEAKRGKGYQLAPSVGPQFAPIRTTALDLVQSILQTAQREADWRRLMFCSTVPPMETSS